MPTLPLTRLRASRTSTAPARYSIGISGCEANDCPVTTLAAAQNVGQTLAQLDQTVMVTMAPGVPHAAAEAAKANGGVVIGFTPAASYRQRRHLHELADDSYTSCVYSDMDFAECTELWLRSCQAIIFIVGRSTPWPEVTTPLSEDMVVGVLTEPAHSTEEVAHIVSLAKGNNNGIIYESDQRILIGRVMASLQRQQASGKI